MILALNGGIRQILHAVCVEDLADRVLRPRRLPLRKRRHRAVLAERVALRAYIPASQFFAESLVLKQRSLARRRRRIAREFEDLAILRPRRSADRKALVHQRDQRDIPAIADLAKALGIRNAYIREIDLVEVRSARHLVNRPNIHTR